MTANLESLFNKSSVLIKGYRVTNPLLQNCGGGKNRREHYVCLFELYAVNSVTEQADYKMVVGHLKAVSL